MNKNVLKGSIISAVIMTAVFAFAGVASAASTLAQSTALTLTQANTWTTDRHDPASWTGGVSAFGKTDVLTVGVSGIVDAQQADPNGNFYRTEGKKLTFASNVTSVETNLYIDPAWANQAVRAGVWATTNSASPEYGIIEYTTAHGFTPGTEPVQNVTFRIWDSTNGTWTPVSSTATVGSWAKLRVELSDADDRFNYYINDVLVGTGPATEVDSTMIKEVILNQYNFGAEADTDSFAQGAYNVNWNSLNTVQTHATIQAAVDAATAGDTITVAAGSYNENVVINKALTLKGAQFGVAVAGRTFAAGSESTVGGIANGTGTITINAANVTVDGFSITDVRPLFATYGVVVKSGGANAVISNNIIDTITSADTGSNGTAQGIYLENGPDGVQILSNKINNIHSNRSAKGVLVGANGASNPSTDVLIQGNTITNVTSDARGAYGISNGTATPGHSNLQIKNNTITTLNGAWAHAIGLEGDTPSAVVTGNTISSVTGAVGPTGSSDATGVFFQENASSAGVNLSSNSFDTTSMKYGVALHSTMTTNADASKNYWNNGNVNPSDKTATSSTATITVSPWYKDAAMTTLTDGTVITTATATSSSSTSTNGVTTTTEIEAGTTISGDSNWDGNLQTPTIVASIGVTPSNNNSVTSTILSIEVGSTQSQLTLSKAAKLTFAGQKDKLVAWSFNNGTSHPIAACDVSVVDEASATASLSASGGECKVNEGNDLVVWTMHFTTFSVYTETAATVSSGGGGGGNGPVSGGGGGGGGGAVALPNNGGGQTGTTGTTGATTGTTGATTGGTTGGQVLGASTYNFTTNLSIGSKGADVTALQQILIDAGYLKISAPTGFYGPLTASAVKMWQKAHGISQTGTVGPLTRASLNAGATPTMGGEQNATLLASLTAQLQALQIQLAALIAAKAN